MGYAFTFPVLATVSALLGRAAPIGAYVHYPTISTTMLDRVQNRATGVTNSATVASSSILSTGKLWFVPFLIPNLFNQPDPELGTIRPLCTSTLPRYTTPPFS
jgi:hypothetical protein